MKKLSVATSSFAPISFLLFILAIFLCFGAFYLAETVGKQDVAKTLEDVDSSNRNTALVVEENVRLMLTQSDSILLMMKADLESQGFIDPIHQELLQTFLQVTPIRQIGVANASGDLIFSAIPLAQPTNISNREHFIAHTKANTASLFISQPLISPVVPKATIFLSRRINDSHGNFNGIVTIGLEQQFLSNLFEKLSLNESNSFTLLRKDGVFLSRLPNNIPQEELTRHYATHLVFSRLAQGETSGVYEITSGVDKITRLGAFRTMPDYPLVVLATLAKETVLQPALNRWQYYRYTAGLFSLILLIILFALWHQYKKQVLALQANQKLYKSLITQTSEAVAVVDGTTLQIKEVNSAFETTFGYSATEAARLSMSDFEDKNNCFCSIEDAQFLVQSGIKPEIIHCYKHKKGELVIVQRRSTLLEYNGSKIQLFSFEDLTEQLHLSKELFLALSRLEIATTIGNIGVWEWNFQTGEITINENWASMIGYSLEELLPLSLEKWRSTIHPDDLHTLQPLIFDRSSPESDCFSRDYRRLHKCGKTIWVHGKGKIIAKAPDGTPQIMAGVVLDITDRKLAEETILHHATHDALTDLATLRLANDRLSMALNQAHRQDTKVALFFLDLDGFKAINDNYGHTAGDYVLQQVACSLRAALRSTDTAARVGGDEFLVIATGLDYATDAEIIAKNLIKNIAQPIHWKKQCFTVSTSIGISLYPDHACDIDSLIVLADKAMYTVKSTSKNGYTFATVASQHEND